MSKQGEVKRRTITTRSRGRRPPWATSHVVAMVVWNVWKVSMWKCSSYVKGGCCLVTANSVTALHLCSDCDNQSVIHHKQSHSDASCFFSFFSSFIQIAVVRTNNLKNQSSHSKWDHLSLPVCFLFCFSGSKALLLLLLMISDSQWVELVLTPLCCRKSQMSRKACLVQKWLFLLHHMGLRITLTQTNEISHALICCFWPFYQNK